MLCDKEAAATSKNSFPFCDKHKAEDDANILGVAVVPKKDDSERKKRN